MRMKKHGSRSYKSHLRTVLFCFREAGFYLICYSVSVLQYLRPFGILY